MRLWQQVLLWFDDTSGGNRFGRIFQAEYKRGQWLSDGIVVFDNGVQTESAGFRLGCRIVHLTQRRIQNGQMAHGARVSDLASDKTA
ncbi:hypothetical protein CAP48_06925 [Advenella sp. S44]|nr:hypothetical protein CAP48_06925 [Advenella sp. S44]